MAESLRGLALAAASGALFAIGLGVSGMTRTDKVLGFLHAGAGWDPSLLVVMATAVPVHALAWAWRRRNAPADPAPLSAIDARLVGGAALFGVGWGLAGACPGPALVNLAAGGGALWFVGAMAAGMGLARPLARLYARAQKSAEAQDDARSPGAPGAAVR